MYTSLYQDLQKFLDSASDGVIYFSMGSVLQSSDLPDYKRDALLEAFSELKQHVLWKWETEALPAQPSNVRVGKWFPQADILGTFMIN
jgi:glucuronosyltransferase